VSGENPTPNASQSANGPNAADLATHARRFALNEPWKILALLPFALFFIRVMWVARFSPDTALAIVRSVPTLQLVLGALVPLVPTAAFVVGIWLTGVYWQWEKRTNADGKTARLHHPPCRLTAPHGASCSRPRPADFEVGGAAFQLAGWLTADP
jgi:hypothetical protein